MSVSDQCSKGFEIEQKNLLDFFTCLPVCMYVSPPVCLSVCLSTSSLIPICLKLDLVVDLVTVGGFAFLFDCAPVGRASGSVAVPAWRLIYWWDGGGLMLWLLSGQPGFTCWISFVRCSVLLNVEYLSLLCLLLLYWFINKDKKTCIET